MEKISQSLPNGNTINYKIINGTAYHEETPDKIVNIIENARISNRSIRLRFCYGDTETGRDWGDTIDQCGYIGRSTGSIKVPLIIKKINSFGGGAILDNCIIKVEQKHHGDKVYTEVYKHSNYHK